MQFSRSKGPSISAQNNLPFWLNLNFVDSCWHMIYMSSIFCLLTCSEINFNTVCDIWKCFFSFLCFAWISHLRSLSRWTILYGGPCWSLALTATHWQIQWALWYFALSRLLVTRQETFQKLYENGKWMWWSKIRAVCGSVSSLSALFLMRMRLAREFCTSSC